MRIVNHDQSGDAQSPYDHSGVLAPWLWYGEGEPNAESLFSRAPAMSLYIDIAGRSVHLKTQDTNTGEDWIQIAPPLIPDQSETRAGFSKPNRFVFAGEGL